jgi:glucose-6-phosphate dehydrogenase assembly protein OpcA
VSSGVIFPAYPEQILKGLGKLWTTLGQEEKQHGKPTVLRACAMTLIVATDEEDAGYTASLAISELMKEHPSRGIVLAVSETAEHDLEARVLAQCWKPFGKAQQICCEEIEITARPSSWPNVGPTLVGLVAADLPVFFWCRHRAALRRDATAAEKEGLAAIVDISQKIIFDSQPLPTQDAIDLIEEWQSHGRVVADLEWTRLTPWREPLCHIFANETRDKPFANFKQIEIQHAEEKPPLSALYMGAWLSKPYGAKVMFRQVKGFVPGLHRVILQSPKETIELGRTGADCATLSSSNGPSRRYNFGAASLTTLLTEELSVEGTDPVFNSVLTQLKGLTGQN